ncbi:enoyl-CoA hydratase/isomerase family protein [Saccharothrix variisporea]|uniref:Enoyl-CoA hydratase/isomerase-like protein n=1 Tax=Saccharothrix variisporea TaxID=543527 RepID=A0A495XKL9_9PSEU|nr:enoyl-CoA hydratase/isomerase family protein [Saccharothrix variisporea]RKT74432.1 enoyl-CoA hydratase/isomerase-like protein [Saccharothrix variisporea]
MVNPTAPHRLSLSLGAPAASDVTAVEELVRRDTAGAALVVDVSGDPEAPRTPPDIAVWTKWEKALVGLERLPVPTLGSVDGPVRGTVLQFLLALDFRVATPATVLSCTEVAEGHLPGMALYRLTRLTGLATARRVVLSGAGLTATTAADLGLFDTVGADRGALVERLLAGLRYRRGSSWKLARRLLHESSGSSFENLLGGVLAAQDRLIREAEEPR